MSAKGTFVRWTAPCIALCLAGPVSAEVVAYWDFNDNLGDLYNWGASYGTGTLTLDPAWTNVGTGNGTDLNAMAGHAPGLALSLKSNSNNGREIDFSVSTVGYEGIQFSFDTERNNPGFNGNQIWYSLDGVNYDLFGPYNAPTSYATMNFDLSSITELNDALEVFIRIRFNGASNNGGINLIDNAMISATLIPAPGALGLMAMAAVLAGRTRRRR